MRAINKNKIQYTTAQKTVFILASVFFALYALSMIYPLFWLFVNTFKTGKAYYEMNFFPREGQWAFNYLQAFSTLKVRGQGVLSMLFNSLWYSVGGAFLGVAVSTCLAYVVSKYKFFGRRLLTAIAIIIMMIPVVGALPSQYRIFNMLGMINSPLILLCFTSGFGLNYLIMIATFDSLSWSFSEAAFIDGAGHFRAFFTIMLPQVIAPLSGLILVSFIGIWNDYMSPLIFIPKLPTLATGLYVYESLNSRKIDEMNMPIYFSGIVICMLPVLILFLVFQNTIMEISMSGGVKE